MQEDSEKEAIGQSFEIFKHLQAIAQLRQEGHITIHSEIASYLQVLGSIIIHMKHTVNGGYIKRYLDIAIRANTLTELHELLEKDGEKEDDEND